MRVLYVVTEYRCAFVFSGFLQALCETVSVKYIVSEYEADVIATDKAFSYYECVGYASLDFLDLVCDVYAKV